MHDKKETNANIRSLKGIRIGGEGGGRRKRKRVKKCNMYMERKPIPTIPESKINRQ